jgi:hypothetical protein
MTQVPRPQDPPPAVLVHPAGPAVAKAVKVREGAGQTSADDYFTDVTDTRAAEPAVPAGT